MLRRRAKAGIRLTRAVSDKRRGYVISRETAYWLGTAACGHPAAAPPGQTLLSAVRCVSAATPRRDAEPSARAQRGRSTPDAVANRGPLRCDRPNGTPSAQCGPSSGYHAPGTRQVCGQRSRRRGRRPGRQCRSQFRSPRGAMPRRRACRLPVEIIPGRGSRPALRGRDSRRPERGGGQQVLERVELPRAFRRGSPAPRCEAGRPSCRPLPSRATGAPCGRGWRRFPPA